MTISSNVTKANYVGDGVAVSFTFNNRVFAASDLAVFVDGVEQTGGFSVQDLDTAAAKVVFNVAPLDTLTIAIVSVIPIQQLTAFKNQGRFNAEVHEDEFDRTNLRILKTQDLFNGTIRLPIDETPTDANTIVPDVQTRLASFFIWDNVGNIIAIKVEDLLGYIGGTKIGAGDGLFSTYDAPSNTTSLNVGAGAGIQVNADDIEIAPAERTILDNSVYAGIGLGTVPALVQDLNTMLRTGMFPMDAASLNNPNLEDGLLFVIAEDPLNTAQIFMQLSGSQVAYRSQVAGIWNGWDVSITTGNVLQVLNAAYISFVDDGGQTPQYNNLQDAVTACLTALGTRFDPSGHPLVTATNVQDVIYQIVSILEFITSGVQFEGVWNATTNTPPIDTFTPNSGDFYIVSVEGTTDLSNPTGTPDPAGDPLNDWKVADVAIFDAVAGDNGYVGWNRRPDAGRITNASTVVFDPVNYLVSFPADATPPTTSQQAHDKVWPFAKQVVDSNVGKGAYSGLITDYAALLSAQFNTSMTGNTDHPNTTDKVSIISGLSDVADTFGLMALSAEGSPRVYFNNVIAGLLGAWQEGMVLEAPQTSPSANLILRNADAGNIGKTSVTAPSDILLSPTGFFKGTDVGFPTAGSYFTTVIKREAGNAAYTLIQDVGDSTATTMHIGTIQDDGISAYFSEVFSSDTRTSAQANTILDNVTESGIGSVKDIPDLLLENHLPFFGRMLSAAGGNPGFVNGSIINLGFDGAPASKLLFNSGTDLWVGERESALEPSWTKIAKSTDLAAYLPLDGSQPMTGDLVSRKATHLKYLSTSASIDDNYWFIETALAGSNTSGYVGDVTLPVFGSVTSWAIHSIADNTTVGQGWIWHGNSTGLVTTPVASLDSTNGNYSVKGDVTAFLGTTVVSQPSIAATGQTTAYDLIELLLDKVEELETRLANAGIA